MRVDPVIVGPASVGTRFPILEWHFSRMTVLAASIGALAAVDGAVWGALIGGVFVLLNTGLTMWLTGKREDRREQDRHGDHRDGEQEGE